MNELEILKRFHEANVGLAKRTILLFGIRKMNSAF